MTGACPVCGHDIETEHPTNDAGEHYCSRSIDAPPSCRACLAQLERIAQAVAP